MRTLVVLAGVAFLITQAAAQTLLFDFENMPAGSGLPFQLSVAGFSARFSASGLGGFYLQQPQNTILYTPAGFSGNCLIPTAVYAADLHVGFSRTVTDFSILYAPQELACDSSARMRVTAYLNGVLVGTSTTNASPGTWPSETLAFHSPQGFNSVVVHYDAPPPTGGDYGTIFVADNMSVTLAPIPPALRISWVTHQIQIAWPTNAAGFTLQANTDLFNASTWVTVANTPLVSGDENTVALPIESATGFYRLLRP